MEFLEAHKDIASVEVTPQHLTLDASLYDVIGTRLQMNPPVRTARHRDGLWRGLARGVADIIGSDHAPHTLEEKAKPYPESPSGMPGVQTLVPVMLDHVNAGRMSLARFIDMTSAGPARLFGVARKGRIACGFDADFTIVDMKRKETIRDNWIASRCGWTPYDGKLVTGWPVGTIVRGKRVMWDGELASPSQGQAGALSRGVVIERRINLNDAVDLSSRACRMTKMHRFDGVVQGRGNGHKVYGAAGAVALTPCPATSAVRRLAG